LRRGRVEGPDWGTQGSGHQCLERPQAGNTGPKGIVAECLGPVRGRLDGIERRDEQRRGLG